MSKSMKRIHKVVIKRMVDDSPDTSFLGEYANKPESEYTIDRDHDTDCAMQGYNPPVFEYNSGTHNIDIAYARETDGTCADCGATPDECIAAPCKYADRECTCGGRARNTREYRYYNPPVENYKGIPHDEIVKYCIQDYERMESLNSQQWYFMGIRAEATIGLQNAWNDKSSTLQKITSGGLWGIESDSDTAYLKEIEQEQLSELRNQLHAIGFSTRAISAAFRDVKEEN